MISALSTTTAKIAGNTVYQLMGKVISMSVTILATVILTRIYGREGFGEFNIMQTYPALFFIIVDFGINAIAARDLSTDWSKAEKYLGNIVVLRTALSLAIMLVAAVMMQFFPYNPALKLGIILSSFLILTQSLFATSNIIFQVRMRYDLSVIGSIAGSVTVLVLVLAMAYFRVPVMWLSFSYVIGGFITAILNFNFISRLGVKVAPQIDTLLIKTLLIQSLPLGLMFVFSQLNFKMDAIFLSFLPVPDSLGLSNTESVGVYGLPYKVFEVSLVIPTFFMNAVYPVMVRHSLEGAARLKETFVRVMGFLLLSAFIISLTGVLLAPLIINVLGGHGFYQSVTVLRVLLGGLMLFYVSQPISWLIVTLGGQKYLPLVYLISAVFNVGLNYMLIPVYSFYASSVITLLSEAIILTLLAFIAVKVWKQRYV
jgi:O-antigen/teichoic acid export membrane protein